MVIDNQMSLTYYCWSGLALPEECRKLIRDRLPQVLRATLNLWILLYVSADNEVYAYAPHEELPF